MNMYHVRQNSKVCIQKLLKININRKQKSKHIILRQGVHKQIKTPQCKSLSSELSSYSHWILKTVTKTLLKDFLNFSKILNETLSNHIMMPILRDYIFDTQK